MALTLTSKASASASWIGARSSGTASCSTSSAPRPFIACSVAPRRHHQRQQQRAEGQVVRFFKFGKNGVGAEDAGIVGSQGRDEYTYDDVEQYFNYMGCLADEGTYDRMEALLKGRHPIDVILLLAAAENDTPKIQEILRAGADIGIKNLEGKTPLELATKAETRRILTEAATKSAVAA